VPTCINESNGRRVKSAQIFKCYALENVGVGQIGILFTFPGGSQFSRCTGQWRLGKKRSVPVTAGEATDKNNDSSVLLAVKTVASESGLFQRAGGCQRG